MLSLKTFIENPKKYLKNKENLLEIYKIIYDLNISSENKLNKDDDFLNKLNQKYPLVKLNIKNSLIDNFYDISIGNKNLKKLINSILDLSNRYVELELYIINKDKSKKVDDVKIDNYGDLKNDIQNFINNFTNKYDTNIFLNQPEKIYTPDTPLPTNMLPKDYYKFLTNDGTKELPKKKDTSDNELDVFSLTISKDVLLFEDKKVLFSNITDAINERFINDYKYAAVFTYLVNTVYNGVIKKLKVESKLNFQYKGGQAIMNIFRSIKNLLSDDTQKALDGYFKRSDADYQINILESSDNVQNFNNLHRQGLDIIIQCNNFIKTMLTKYDNIIFDFNRLNQKPKFFDETDDNLGKIIKNLNDSINGKDSDFYFKNFKVIGITYNDKTKFIEEIPNNFRYIRVNDEKVDNLIKTEYQFKRNKKVDNSYRNDFYVTIDRNSSNFKGLGTNSNSLYSYLNETTFFGNENVSAIFSLGRIKLNSVIYLKDNKNNYTFLNCPGEVLDVSLPKIYDSKSVTSPEETKKLFQEYKYNEPNNPMNIPVTYKSYNLNGFIKDFFPQFDEKEYIWLIPKFEKKLKRLIFFLSIYMSKEGDDKFKEIKSQFINNLNILTSINILTKTNGEYNLPLGYREFNETYKLLNRFFIVLFNNYFKTNNNNDRTKLNNIVRDNIIREIQTYNYVKYQYEGQFDLTYINKYLKYKSKYLNLKNKIK
jgi:hypothetical protein